MHVKNRVAEAESRVSGATVAVPDPPRVQHELG